MSNSLHSEYDAIGEALDDAISNGDGRPTAGHLLVELEHRGLMIVSAGAIQAEREECAKTICLHCREGRPVARRGIDLWLHGFDGGDGYECHPCSAYAVRERAIASANKELRRAITAALRAAHAAGLQEAAEIVAETVVTFDRNDTPSCVVDTTRQQLAAAILAQKDQAS